MKHARTSAPALPEQSDQTSWTDTDSTDAEQVTFADLGLPDHVLSAITSMGFTSPTPIQAAAIPALLSGEDIVGVAQTGTGKTAAFGLPMLAAIEADQFNVQGLVLVPTRELALQVASALESFAADLPTVSVVTIYGGAPFYPQKRALQDGAQIVVGTPGRVIDHLERGTLDLSNVSYVVLDEGDEMLRMGFAEDVERILSDAPTERQTALFSATLPTQIRNTVKAHMRNARQIAVTPQSSTGTSVDQCYAVVPSKHKIGALARVLATTSAEAAIVFVHTRAAAEEVGAALVERGISASVISGSVAQVEREKIVERLRSGQVTVLVATDVAARGLDVDRIGLVVNFDMPRKTDEYVHRIGRTGRAGRTGTAFSFVGPKEMERVRRLEKATGTSLQLTPIPTPAEVSAHRVSGLLAQVSGRLANGRLQVAQKAVEEYLDGHDDDISARLAAAIDLATALTALAVGDQGPASREDDELDADLARLASRDKGKRGSKDRSYDMDGSMDSSGSDRKRYSRDENRHGRSGLTRYWIGVGHRDRVKPGAIVGAITAEGGLRGQDLGAIEMFSTFSIVEIAPELSRQTQRRLAQARVAGRALRLRPDLEHGDRGDRFDRGDRGDRGDRHDRHDRGDRGDRAPHKFRRAKSY
ncbi:MAG: DEAD/DEAH box helicase [Propionibacteriaceae bacterium]|nr:DEAD/DEAH box helicase [Propionibacteriaceae bacterium]